MILGFRRSVPSQLRNILLSPGPPKTIRDLEQWASCSKTRLSSCYLIFCSPSSVLVVERDLAKTTALISTDFLACTNHDVDMEDITPEERILLLQRHGFVGNTVEHIIAESVERKECIVQMQRQTKRRVTLSKVKKWLEQVPVVNEATHYSCIMDPSAEGGGLLWVQQYPSSE
ncbi:hypothetical protein APHAL10511_005756 [Amanita phalloides]|nr:hypothetical protein APHAL10511_005756 [Amanita phalloides]